jgi:hypothetical protein
MKKSRRVYLNEKRTKHCTVILFETAVEMRAYYAKQTKSDDNECHTLGVHVARIVRGKKQNGTVLLSLEFCNPSVVAHEFLHAILWARKRKTYPIVIKSPWQEEKLAYNLSYALSQFYSWQWKVADGEKLK